MYVGAWQEYNLHKVIELYKKESSSKDGGSTKAGSRRRLESSGGDSAATAPYRKRNIDASSMASSSRSAYTDVDEYRRQRRELHRGLNGGRGSSYGGRGGGAKSSSTRPRPGGKKAGRARKGTDAEDDETTERRRKIEQMARLYRGEVPDTPDTKPPGIDTAPGDASLCPHCSTPYERFCSKTGQPHMLGGSASGTPQQVQFAAPPGGTTHSVLAAAQHEQQAGTYQHQHQRQPAMPQPPHHPQPSRPYNVSPSPQRVGRGGTMSGGAPPVSPGGASTGVGGGLGTSVIAQLMRARDSTKVYPVADTTLPQGAASNVDASYTSGGGSVYHHGFHQRAGMPNRDTDVPAPSQQPQQLHASRRTTSPMSHPSSAGGVGGILPHRQQTIAMHEQQFRVDSGYPNVGSAGVAYASGAAPTRIQVSPPPMHSSAVPQQQHQSPDGGLFHRASDAARAPRPLSDVSLPRAGAGGGKVSTAITHGNILSPCGTPTGVSPTQAPIRRPAQRTHVDDDDFILRMSQTLKSIPDNTVRPISSPGLPSASEVEALLQWTDNLASGPPGTPSWPAQF